MAVRNGTAEWVDYLGRTTNVPAFNNPLTFLCWFQVITNPSSYSLADLISIRSEPAGTFYYEELGVYYIPGTGTQLYARANNNGTAADGLGSAALSANTWYCAAYVRASDGDRRLFLGSLTSLLAQDGNTITATTGTFGVSSAFLGVAEARSGVVRIGNTKIWGMNLSLDQLQAEQFVMRPVDPTNMSAWLPFLDTGTSRGKDYAGNGDLTTYGTMTDEDNPPVSYGAAVLTLPYVAASGGTNVTVTASPVGFQIDAPAAAVTAIQNATIDGGAPGMEFGAGLAVVSAIWNVTVAAGAGELSLGIEASTVSTTSTANINIDAGAVGIDFDAGPAEVVAAWNVTIAAGACELALGVQGGSVSTTWNVNVSAPAPGFEISVVGAGIATVRNINIPAGIDTQGMEFGIAGAIILIAEPITPTERKLRIQADNRTLHIQKDERTLHIHAGNQTLRVQREDRKLKIRPESRVIRIER